MAVQLNEMQHQLAGEGRNLPSVTVGFSSLESFELMQRGAKLLASSSLVPKDYQGNLPNCVIALNMSQRLGADPLMVMQNLYVVHGRPGWSSQFLIATFNQCGRFSAMRFEFFGERGTDGWGCRAWAIEKATGDRLTGSDITIKIAKDEGWYDKNGSKWKSMPQQMLMYRAASWFVRAYAPELSMGLQTTDELGDVYDATQGPDGAFTVDNLRDVAPKASTGETIDQETGEVTRTQPEAPEPGQQEASQDGDGNHYAPNGEKFDPEIHVGPNHINADGSFRRKRGAGPARGAGTKPEPQGTRSRDGAPTLNDVYRAAAAAQDADGIAEAVDLANSLEGQDREQAMDAIAAREFNLGLDKPAAPSNDTGGGFEFE